MKNTEYIKGIKEQITTNGYKFIKGGKIQMTTENQNNQNFQQAPTPKSSFNLNDPQLIKKAMLAVGAILTIVLTINLFNMFQIYKIAADVMEHDADIISSLGNLPKAISLTKSIYEMLKYTHLGLYALIALLIVKLSKGDIQENLKKNFSTASFAVGIPLLGYFLYKVNFVKELASQIFNSSMSISVVDLFFDESIINLFSSMEFKFEMLYEGRMLIVAAYVIALIAIALGTITSYLEMKSNKEISVDEAISIGKNRISNLTGGLQSTTNQFVSNNTQQAPVQQETQTQTIQTQNQEVVTASQVASVEQTNQQHEYAQQTVNAESKSGSGLNDLILNLEQKYNKIWTKSLMVASAVFGISSANLYFKTTGIVSLFENFYDNEYASISKVKALISASGINSKIFIVTLILFGIYLLKLNTTNKNEVKTSLSLATVGAGLATGAYCLFQMKEFMSFLKSSVSNNMRIDSYSLDYAYLLSSDTSLKTTFIIIIVSAVISLFGAYILFLELKNNKVAKVDELKEIVSNTTNSFTQQDGSKKPGKANILIPIIALAAVLLFAVPKVIDHFKPIAKLDLSLLTYEVKYEGINKHAQAHVNFYKDYSLIYTSKKGKESDNSKVQKFLSTIEVELSKDKDLANGDVIVSKFKYDEELAKQYKIVIENNDPKEIEVKGLIDIISSYDEINDNYKQLFLNKAIEEVNKVPGNWYVDYNKDFRLGKTLGVYSKDGNESYNIKYYIETFYLHNEGWYNDTWVEYRTLYEVTISNIKGQNDEYEFNISMNRSEFDNVSLDDMNRTLKARGYVQVDTGSLNSEQPAAAETTNDGTIGTVDVLIDNLFIREWASKEAPDHGFAKVQNYKVYEKIDAEGFTWLKIDGGYIASKDNEWTKFYSK